MTYKDFTAGDIFTADDADLLMRQGLIVVADQAARDAIIAPTEGMRVYRLDTHAVDIHGQYEWETGAGVVCALDSGMTGGAVFAYRRDGLILVEGYVSGTFVANVTTNVCNVPATHRPRDTRGHPTAWSNGELGWGWVHSGGNVAVRKPTAGAGNCYVQAVYID